MQFSTILVAAFAAFAIAAPLEANECPPPPPSSTSVAPPKPTASSTSAAPPKPTATGTTSDCTYTCTGSGAILEALNCVNVATGVPISVPITVGSKMTKRAAGTVDYCCKPNPTLLNLITCVNILTGSSLSLPITLFPSA